MPVTTKAQRSADSGKSGDGVKTKSAKFSAKIKKFAKSRDNLRGLRVLPAEPIPKKSKRRERTSGSPFLFRPGFTLLTQPNFRGYPRFNPIRFMRESYLWSARRLSKRGSDGRPHVKNSSRSSKAFSNHSN